MLLLLKKALIKIRNVVANQRQREFARNTVCAIAVETSLKAAGRPAFIYYDKHANKQSKKYAATKRILIPVVLSRFVFEPDKQI